ncbi:MAG: class I SAM-dependent methyltransferase [Candidatus Marinimicrobia bacterium]|nr:class I SAM-dependent methyltransferase [Candidatus Neomarinimicrobiota bacterium]
MTTDKWTTKWDQRYSVDEYVFGKEPNVFLTQNVNRLPVGKVLCAGDGEGRNGIWLAKQGFMVTSLDYSRKGLEKARALAEEFQVEIELVQANILEIDLGISRYDAIVNIFLHFAEDKIPHLHSQYHRALKSGGSLLSEVYSKDQLHYNSGGPKFRNALYEPEYYLRDFPGWTKHYLKKEVIILGEGSGHQGKASVVRAILTKPEEE